MSIYLLVDKTGTIVNRVIWDGAAPWSTPDAVLADDPTVDIGYVYSAANKWFVAPVLVDNRPAIVLPIKIT